MALHSALTDPNIHEPKGASTATSGQVYQANGSGSGTWTARLPSQSGKAGQTLITNGTSESWSPLSVTAQAGLVTASAASPTVTFSRNITSVTRTATGVWAVVLSGFANTSYTVHVTGGIGSIVLVAPSISGKTSTGFNINWFYTNTAGAADPATSIVVDITVFGGV